MNKLADKELEEELSLVSHDGDLLAAVGAGADRGARRDAHLDALGHLVDVEAELGDAGDDRDLREKGGKKRKE